MIDAAFQCVGVSKRTRCRRSGWEAGLARLRAKSTLTFGLLNAEQTKNSKHRAEELLTKSRRHLATCQQLADFFPTWLLISCRGWDKFDLKQKIQIGRRLREMDIFFSFLASQFKFFYEFLFNLCIIEFEFIWFKKKDWLVDPILGLSDLMGSKLYYVTNRIWVTKYRLSEFKILIPRSIFSLE